MKNKNIYIIITLSLLTIISVPTILNIKNMKLQEIKTTAIEKASSKQEKITAFYQNNITKSYTPVTKLTNNYNIESAITEKSLVLTNDKCHNFNSYKNFINNLKEKKTSFLRVVFTTIEGDLIINDIKYDNATNKTYVLRDTRRDRFGKQDITIDIYDNIEEQKESKKCKLVVYNENKKDYTELLSLNNYND